ncbi:MAG: DUF5667 domain-containing protein [Dehalococcoidales bacterium]|nr:DUF5667 domain-containing protein [Dehalococcoidales bacterium]
MNRAREFDNILDECLEQILTEGKTVEQCLAGHPEMANELRPLLETAYAAKQATAIKPSAEFRDRAHRQFQTAVYEAMEKRAHRSLFNWHPQWATVAASALIVVLLGGGGTVAAASNSLPDEALYPVKLASEQVRLVLTPTAMGKAGLYVKLTDERVAEIAKMAERGSSLYVDQTAERLNGHLSAIVALNSPQGAAPVAVLMAPTTLSEGAEKSPAALPKPAAAARAPAKDATSEITSAAGESNLNATADNRTDSKEFNKLDRETRLKIIIARKAAVNREALEKALEKAPDSAKPALERAIAASEEGYRHALKSLDEKKDRDNNKDEDDD